MRRGEVSSKVDGFRSAEAIDLVSPYWILHPVSCQTPEAVTTVLKCSWGWSQIASETCRVLLQLLINIMPSCITLVLYIYYSHLIEIQDGTVRRSVITLRKPDGKSSQKYVYEWFRSRNNYSKHDVLDDQKWVTGCRAACGLCRTLHGTQYTHHNLKHMLPQHYITHNDVFLLINSTRV
jgi:hypothetical protein